MHLIDSPGATGDNHFTDGNPATATPATVVWAKWLNNIQDEVAYVITQAGFTLSSASSTQLYEAIMALVTSTVPSVPDATETVKGKVELATTTEASAGVDTVRAVTPAGVKGAIDARIATTTAKGIIEIATSAETIAGSVSDMAVTPATLATLTTSETRNGLIELATLAEANAGSDAVRAITPATLANVLANFDPVPIGLVLPYSGTAGTVPTKYLLAFGQAVSRTTYATLYARQGDAFGGGDGFSTFNLPDVRGRVIAGVDNMGGSTAGRITNAAVGIVGTTLGAAGGSQTQTLTIAQMPSHNHTGLADAVGDHTHPLIVATNGFSNYIDQSLLRNATPTPLGSTGAGGAHNHSLTINAAGGGTAHENVQPTIMMNMIIKVL